MHVKVRPQAFVKKMSPNERGQMRERVTELREQVSDEFSNNLKDKGRIVSEIQKLEFRLADDDSKVARGRGKDKVQKQAAVLEEQLKKEVSPLINQFIREGHPDYQQAMKAAWNASDPKVVRMAEQYKDACLRLEPEDPQAGSIERLLTK